MAVEVREEFKKQGYILLVTIVLLSVAIVLISRLTGFRVLAFDTTLLRTLTTVFLSIIIEAVPFILLGVFVSALIQVFVSEDTVAKFIPKNRFFGILLASIMGLIFPVCECGIVPVARRLMKKGMPASMGISFLLAVPIINPVVMTSTYFAFGNTKVVALRAGIGFIVAVTVAIILAKTAKETPVTDGADSCHDHSCGCSCSHEHHTNETVLKKVNETLSHASEEFFQMGKFLIIGSFIAATLQVAVSRDVVLSIGQSPVPATTSMMGLAYGLSLCSEADAFIAATFVKSFSLPSIVAFLVFGPMLDIKQTLMLLSTFQARFVMRLIAAVTLTVFAISIALHYLL